MDRAVIAQQLARISKSRVFAEAGRMLPLLEYLVDASVGSGSADQRRIAIDVFNRDERFDPTCDAIVRVEIGRLRNKLREYYATDGGADEIIIDIPKGKYRVRVRLRRTPAYVYPASVPPQCIRRCVTPDGVTIAYSTIGDGYPLVMLPHWLSHLDADLKNPLVQHYWIELSRRFQLIRFDSRGFGLSDRDVPDFSFDALVTDVETVVDALGLARFALLGPSGGAAVGTAYAARHAVRVSHLILLGGFIRGLRRIDDPLANEHADVIETIVRVGWGEPHSRFRQFFSSMLVPDGTPEQYRWMDDAQRAASSGEAAERYFRILGDFDLSDEASAITAATLVAHATEETGVPLREARHAVDRIPGARLALLATKNHLLMPDEPAWAAFLRELDELFARIPPSSDIADSPVNRPCAATASG